MAGVATILSLLSQKISNYYRNPPVITTVEESIASGIDVQNTLDEWLGEVVKLGEDNQELKDLPPNSIIVTPATPDGDFQVIGSGTVGQVLTITPSSLPSFEDLPSIGGVNSYVHPQGVPSTTWTITHNLGFYPNITVFDSTERSILTEIEHIDTNSAIVHNDAAFSGKAYCS